MSEDVVEEGSFPKIKKPATCKYGASCFRKNPEHLRDFYHPPPPGSVAPEKSKTSGADESYSEGEGDSGVEDSDEDYSEEED